LFKGIYLLLISVTVELVEVELEVVAVVFLTRWACALVTIRRNPKTKREWRRTFFRIIKT